MRGLALALAATLLGCEADPASSPAGEPRFVDAGTDAPAGPVCDPAAILGQICAAPEWAPAPVWTVVEMTFAVEDAEGRVPGFDLDGHVTRRGDAAGCGRPDFMAPDGTEGIDNQLASLWPLITQVTGDAVDGLIQGAINEGKLLITLAVAEPAGESTLAVGKLAGVPLLGTDGFILPHQTFGPDPFAVPVTARGAWLDEERYAGGGGVDLLLPIDILDFQLEMRVREARFAFDRLPDGGITGYFGGGVQVAEFMAALDDAAVPLNLRDFIRNLMSQRADLDPDAEGRCQTLSTALVFRAVPAYLADWEVETRPTPP